MNKGIIETEIIRELKMRRDVWDNIRTPQGPVFKKNIHQQYFDRLKFLSEILPEITAKEWADLCQRRERTVLASQAEDQPDKRQTALFSFPE